MHILPSTCTPSALAFKPSSPLSIKYAPALSPSHHGYSKSPAPRSFSKPSTSSSPARPKPSTTSQPWRRTLRLHRPRFRRDLRRHPLTDPSHRGPRCNRRHRAHGRCHRQPSRNPRHRSSRRRRPALQPRCRNPHHGLNHPFDPQTRSPHPRHQVLRLIDVTSPRANICTHLNTSVFTGLFYVLDLLFFHCKDRASFIAKLLHQPNHAALSFFASSFKCVASAVPINPVAGSAESVFNEGTSLANCSS